METRPGLGVRCKPFDKGWVALRRSHGSWRVRQKGVEDACAIVHVPVAVRRDLRIPCFPLLP